jgi:hypothetical protein
MTAYFEALKFNSLVFEALPKQPIVCRLWYIR